MIEFYTIGVYNSNEDEFFKKLTDNKIDTFCDIRRRRGVRGSKYSFVNSKRLQQKLNLLNINYTHILDLAPTQEIRELQKQADSLNSVNKRDRKFLGSVFVSEFKKKILKEFSFNIFFEELKKLQTKRIVLFCVEEHPKACHRSIIAEKLEEDYKLEITHL